MTEIEFQLWRDLLWPLLQVGFGTVLLSVGIVFLRHGLALLWPHWFGWPQFFEDQRLAREARQNPRRLVYNKRKHRFEARP